MHLQIMTASTRDLAYNLFVRKKNKKTKKKHLFDIIIIISIDYGVFQKITLKQSAAYVMRSNNDKGTHSLFDLNDRLNFPNC